MQIYENDSFMKIIKLIFQILSIFRTYYVHFPYFNRFSAYLKSERGLYKQFLNNYRFNININK